MDPVTCFITFYWFHKCSIKKKPNKKDVKTQKPPNILAFSKCYNFIFWSVLLQISFHFTLKAIVRDISGISSTQDNCMYADHTPSIHLSLKRLLINLQGFGFTLAKDLQQFSSSKISNFILFFK